MTSLLCSGWNIQHFPEQSLVQDDLISLPSDLKKKKAVPSEGTTLEGTTEQSGK